MKFILNEKFILDERLILTEADDTSITEAKEAIKKTISNEFSDSKFIAAANYFSDKKAAIKTAAEIKKAEDALEKQFAGNQKDWAILQGKAKEYCTVLKDEINKIDSGNGATLNSLEGAKALITNLEDSSAATPTDEEKEMAIETLKNNFTELKTSVDAAIESDTKVDEYDKDNIDFITEVQNQLMDTYGKILKLTGQGSAKDALAITLNEFNKTLLANKLPSVVKTEDDGDKVIDNLTNVQNACQSLENDVDMSQFTPEKNTAGRDDWATKFAQNGTAEEKAKLWDSYWETEWGNQASKVRALGTAFVQELLELGFTENTNPFITFVKRNLDSLNLTAKNYAAIHNAYVNNYITDEDLLSSGDNNLLFNTTVLSFASIDIINYLKAQYILRNNLTNDIAKSKGYRDADTAIAAAFTNNINVEKHEIPRETSLDKIRDIRPWSGVQAATKFLTGGRIDSEDGRPELTVKKLLQDLNFDTRPADEKVKVAKAYIRYIVDTRNTDKNNIQRFITIYNLPKLTDEEKKTIKNYIQKYKISWPDNFIQDLAERAGVV